MPRPITQAVVLRDFVARATALGIDYNIVEAIDQPEKLFEGNVGPYWGILDASLRPKFAWTGRLVDPEYWKAAGCAVLVGLLLSLSILLLPGATIGQVALLAGADHVIGDWCASVLGYWHAHYFLHGEVIAFGIGLPLLGLLAPILLSRVGELAAVTLAANPSGCWRISPHARTLLRQRSRSIFPRTGNRRRCCCVPSIRWRGSNTRISNAWLSSTTRRIRRSGSRSRRAAANSVRVQVSARRKPPGVQGRCPSARNGGDRGRCRDHRRHRCRLCGRSPMAHRSGPELCRSRGWAYSGPAGSSRRRSQFHPFRHERRICRLLRYRHGRAQRIQRHHRSWHHVPDPPYGDGGRRRLVE